MALEQPKRWSRLKQLGVKRKKRPRNVSDGKSKGKKETQRSEEGSQSKQESDKHG